MVSGHEKRPDPVIALIGKRYAKAHAQHNIPGHHREACLKCGANGFFVHADAPLQR